MPSGYGSLFNVWQNKNEKQYLINTLHSSVVEIEHRDKENIVEILKGNKDIDKYDEYSAILAEQGFLNDDSYDELATLEYEYYSSYFDNSYLNITWIPTMRCNFTCDYCFESEKADQIGDSDFEIFKDFLTSNCNANKKMHISLFGGEPLLQWGKIKEAGDLLNSLVSKNDYSFSMTTNGYYINADMIEEMIEKYNFGNMQITIDGNQKTHDRFRTFRNGEGSYKEIISKVKMIVGILKEKNIDSFLTVRINLFNHALSDINELLKEFTDEEKLYFKVLFRPIYNTENFQEENKIKNLEAYYELARKSGFGILSPKDFTGLKMSACEADSGLNTFQIMPNLSIWKCINNVEDSESKFGCIIKGGDIQIDKNIISSWSKSNPFKDEKCKACKLLPICWGGCPRTVLKFGLRSCFYEKDFNLVDMFVKA